MHKRRNKWQKNFSSPRSKQGCRGVPQQPSPGDLPDGSRRLLLCPDHSSGEISTPAGAFHDRIGILALVSRLFLLGMAWNRRNERWTRVCRNEEETAGVYTNWPILGESSVRPGFFSVAHPIESECARRAADLRVLCPERWKPDKKWSLP